MPSRLFLAVAPDDETRRRLAMTADRVRIAAGDCGSALRWVGPDNLHVTLHFLGTVADALRDQLVRSLEPPLPLPPIPAALGTVAVAPKTGSPRVVWLSVTPAAAIARVRDVLAERLTVLGLPIESRPFSPHVTLARVRDQHRGRVRTLRARLEALTVPSDPWPVDRVTLFASDLSGAAPVYRALQQTMLTAP